MLVALAVTNAGAQSWACGPGHPQDLALVDSSSLQNAGLAQVAAALPRLRRLSLIKIPWLTNSCISGALTRLHHLTRLQLSDNANIT